MAANRCTVRPPPHPTSRIVAFLSTETYCSPQSVKVAWVRFITRSILLPSAPLGFRTCPNTQNISRSASTSRRIRNTKRVSSVAGLGEVLLDEARAEVDIHLDQGRVTDRAEAVTLPGFDDENVSRAGLEFHAVHRVGAATLPHELHLVVGVAMGPGAAPRRSAEQVHRDVHVAVVGAHEVVRQAYERQVFLTDAVHRPMLLWIGLRGSAPR